MEKQDVLIHDYEYERMVLGTMLSSQTAVNEVRDHLTPDCFFDPKHQEIYDAIVSIDRAGGDVNIITVNAALSKAGALTDPIELVTLSQTYTIGPIVDYALRLKELDMRRKLWELGQQLVQDSATESVDLADIQESGRRRLTEIFASSTADVHTLAEACADLKAQIQRNRKLTGEIYGTPTGFREIDRRGGLSPTDLVVVAGETSMGKTAFATSLAINAILHGHPVAFYSMEMSNIQLAARIAAMRSGINARSILQDALPEDKILAVEAAIDRLPSDMCYFDDDATASFDKIAASIRTLSLKCGIKGAVVDYLQILNVNMRSANKEQAMADVARRLKNLAKELGIWIIALSQLNRDHDSPVPSLNRLRDSGQIGEAADIIALIYRPEARGKDSYPKPYEHIGTQGTAMIDIAKGRNTGIYQFICGFSADTTCFYDISDLNLPRKNSTGGSTTVNPVDPEYSFPTEPQERKLPF